MGTNRVQGVLDRVNTYFNPASRKMTFRAFEYAKPIHMACLCGHMRKLLYFLDNHYADIDEASTVTMNGITEDNITPLCCAILGKNTEIVKVLLSRNASVRWKTGSGRTPLHLACSLQSLDVMEYLIEHGADMNAIDDYDETCLMQACEEKKLDVVKLLLHNGCDVNFKNTTGRSALHFAALSRNLDVFKLLVKNGATFQPDCLGTTPLMTAAVNGSTTIVEYLIQQKNCSDLNKVNALELLGSAYVGEGPLSLQKAYEIWCRAMNLRCKNEKLIRKDIKNSPVSVILNVAEATTLKELEDIYGLRDRVALENGNDYRHEMEMQALLIKERILGISHHKCAMSVLRCCGVLDINQSLELRLHVLEQQQKTLNPVHLDIMYSLNEFYKLFSDMTKAEMSVNYPYIVEVFQRSLTETKAAIGMVNKRGLQEVSPITECINLCLNLIEILCSTSDPPLKTKEDGIKTLVAPFIQMGIRDINDQTPLHYSCTRPCTLKLIQLLLDVGADPNDVDNSKDSSLHLAMINKVGPEVCETLLKHGAHLDIRNKLKKTPLQLMSKSFQSLIQPFQYLSLRCLAAQVVRLEQIRYRGLVPKDIEYFLDLH